VSEGTFETKKEEDEKFRFVIQQKILYIDPMTIKIQGTVVNAQ